MKWSWERTSLTCFNNDTGKFDMPSSSIWLKRPDGRKDLIEDVADGYANMIVKALNDAPMLAEQNEKMLGVLKHIHAHLGDSSKLSYIRVTLDNTIAEIEAK